jgi:outer membrane murein-binding lipoprotein Lpp
VRLFAIVSGFLLLAGCDSQPRQGALPERDETQAAWYAQVIKQVADKNREAESEFKAGKADHASALIQEAQPLVARLLAVRHPNLAATEVASDLDQLYGEMLMSNRHYAWARLMFQKNLSRWKHWSPQTPDTERRYKEAEAAIAECDKHPD